MRLKQILLLALIVSWLRPTDRPTDRQCQLLSCPGQLKIYHTRSKKDQPIQRVHITYNIYHIKIYHTRSKKDQPIQWVHPEMRRNIGFPQSTTDLCCQDYYLIFVVFDGNNFKTISKLNLFLWLLLV